MSNADQRSESPGPEAPEAAIVPDAQDASDSRATRKLPILALRGMIPLPGMPHPLAVTRPFSLAAVNEARDADDEVLLLMQRDAADEDPGLDGFHGTGVTGRLSKSVRTADGAMRLVVQPAERARVIQIVRDGDAYEATIEVIPAVEHEEDLELDALMHSLRDQVRQLVDISPTGNAEVVSLAENISDPGLLADFVATQLQLRSNDLQLVLETSDVKERLAEVVRFAGHALEVAQLGKKIQDEVQGQLEEARRQAYLREQMKAIRKEMGDEDDPDVTRIRKLIAKGVLNKEAQDVAESELRRLESIPSASPERGWVVNYLDWLVSLPWTELRPERQDLAEASAILDREHYGMEKAKERILETLAVRQRNPEGKAPIICFVGPPGTGKTSLAQAVADATDRELVRISVGGVSDESEIRGHRRTYVGAMPGRIISALRKAGSRNPVFVVDEIDKMSASFQGDPAAALLEVLDPEQNISFVDRYIEVPFDLSRVLFITTANTLSTLPRPLLDRLEVIEVPGYTEREKVEIAVRHLVPRQRLAVGMTAKDVKIGRPTLHAIIRGWTREAGVRGLERAIGTVMRKLALAEAKGEKGPWRVKEGDLPTYLGPRRYYHDAVERMAVPGVAMGLAWTPVGGEILFIEAAVIPGRGQVRLTGSLGDVMKESAIAAMTYLRGHGEVTQDLDKLDVHIHVPAGAVPKDGPSAGVAILVALTSAVTGRLARSDTATTGEITLRGQVLPVGGIRDKVLGAARAGVKRIILPKRNEVDLDEVPEEIRKKLTFFPVEHVDEVLDVALVPLRKTKSTAKKASAKKKPVAKKKPPAKKKTGTKKKKATKKAARKKAATKKPATKRKANKKAAKAPARRARPSPKAARPRRS